MTASPVAGANETQFAPEAASPARARDFVERYLNQRDLPYLVDASCLVVSELVTNAVVHARTPIRVSIEELAHFVKLMVYDESADLPVLSRAGRVGIDESGRGLLLVDAVSEDWGIDLAGDEGKCIWALFAVRPRSSGWRTDALDTRSAT